MWKRLRLLCVWTLLMAPSCADGGTDRDPRLGELGRVKWNGGGGCNSSTTLASGSTARMTLEPVEGALPDGLEVSSTAPQAIEATAGAVDDEILLRAVGQGEAHVELHDGETLHDRLSFDVAHAVTADTQSPTATLAGGHYVLRLGELFAACGEDCALIGGDFLRWAADPPAAMSVVEEGYREARFMTAPDAAGTVRVEALEPGGARLLSHAVAVVAPADVGALRAMVTVNPMDDDVREPVPPPVVAPVGSGISVALFVDGPDGEVPLFGADIEWGPSSDASVVRDAGWETPEGPVFAAEAAGSATLTATVALIDATLSVGIEVR